MDDSGKTHVLRMGQQVRILDLPEDLIHLTDLEPGRDIGIVLTGPRPGEELSEKLWDEGLEYEPTDQPDVVLAQEDLPLATETLRLTIDELVKLGKEGDEDAIVDLLSECAPGAMIGLLPAWMPGNIAPFYFFATLGLLPFNTPLNLGLAFVVILHAVVTLPVLLLGGLPLLFHGGKIRQGERLKGS